jgi:hypothetical protein
VCADILAVDVDDASAVTPRHRHRVAGEHQVAGVEQQADIGVGAGHQSVDLGFWIHDRSHVVVKREVNPARAQVAGNFEAAAEGRPVGVRKHRSRGQWRVRIAVSAAVAFGEDYHLATHRGQEVEMRGERRDFLGRAAAAKLRAVPAGDEIEPMPGEDGTQHGSVAWKLAAKLDAGESGQLRLGEAHLERDVAAQLRHVVVGPRDRIDAERHCHVVLSNRCSAPSSRRSSSATEMDAGMPIRGRGRCIAGIVVDEHGLVGVDRVPVEQDPEYLRIRLDDAFLAGDDDAVEPVEKRKARSLRERSLPTSWKARRAAHWRLSIRQGSPPSRRSRPESFPLKRRPNA